MGHDVAGGRRSDFVQPIDHRLDQPPLGGVLRLDRAERPVRDHAIVASVLPLRLWLLLWSHGVCRLRHRQRDTCNYEHETDTDNRFAHVFLRLLCGQIQSYGNLHRTAGLHTCQLNIHKSTHADVFVIKSVVKDVSFTTIFTGVLPFIATDLLRLAILIVFPVIATYLPSRM